MARPLPPPLPSQRLPPPLPSQRPTGNEFDTLGRRQSTREEPFLPSGGVFEIWISTNSTNVNRIRCDRDRDRDGNPQKTGTITIEFLDLSLYEYPDRPLNDFLDLMTSSSKGRYAYYEVRGPGPSKPGMGIWPFRKLRGPQRKVTEAMKEARQPRTEEQKRRFYNVGGRRRAGGGTPSVH